MDVEVLSYTWWLIDKLGCGNWGVCNLAKSCHASNPNICVCNFCFFTNILVAIILEYTGLCVGLFANTCVNNLLAIHKDGSKRIDIYVMCFSLFVWRCMHGAYMMHAHPPRRACGFSGCVKHVHLKNEFSTAHFQLLFVDWTEYRASVMEVSAQALVDAWSTLPQVPQDSLSTSVQRSFSEVNFFFRQIHN